MRPSPVVAEGLSVGYGGQAVIEGLDLGVEAGQVVALVGTNGSGKTTLLSTLGGLIEPVGGVCTVLGADPGAAPSRVAYLRQLHTRDFVLPLRARDVVAMGRYAHRGLVGRFRPVDREAVEEGIERMGIGPIADVALGELSGGQRQRVYLAQALAWRADLLLLDEPAASLDPAARGLLTRAIAEETGRGAAVITATHDVAEALRADWVVLLAGRVVAVGPPQAALSSETLISAFGLGVLEAPGGGLVALDPSHGHGEDDAHAG